MTNSYNATFGHWAWGVVRTLCGLLALLAGTSHASQSAPIELWTSTEWHGTVTPTPQAIGSQPVKVDITQLSSSQQRFSVSLPGQVSVTISRTSDPEKLANGMLIWRGQIEGDNGSAVTFYVKSDKILGTIITSTRRVYHIRFLGSSVHLIEVFDKSKLPPEEDHLLPGSPPGSESGERHETRATLAAARNWKFLRVASSESSTASDEDSNTINLMVVYTEAARYAAGGDDDFVEQRILGLVDETNGSLSNSGVPIKLRLVHVGKYDLEEHPAIMTDLMLFTGDLQRKQSSIRALREDRAADIVILITGPREGQGEACGMSNSMEDGVEHCAKAFGVVPWHCTDLGFDYSFAHELGHIMGAGHEDAQGVRSYSKGYVPPNPRGLDALSWGTIMAIHSKKRIPRWSNPDVDFEGVATGSAEANNRRTLKETAPKVVKFRSCAETQ